MLSPRLLSIVFASSALVAMGPGCSNSTPATPQVGLVWVVEPSTSPAAEGECPVPGEDRFLIGPGSSGNNDDTPVTNGSSWNGTPVSVDCQVSGNDSSGFQLFLQATYGTGAGAQGSLLIQGHVSGTTSEQTGLTGSFLDNISLGGETLSEAPSTGTNPDPGCTITYPNAGMGIASGRIWAHIDCPNALNGNSGHDCDGNADFRFENCTE
jgi:hypothetical protein